MKEQQIVIDQNNLTIDLEISDLIIKDNQATNNNSNINKFLNAWDNYENDFEDYSTNINRNITRTNRELNSNQLRQLNNNE